MKTTIDIADDLLARAKRAAQQEAITLRELTEEGLRLALERRQQREPAQIRPVVVGGPGPAPDLSWPALREVLYGDEGSETSR
jgi:hypothetical protein